jgi:small-conductance mechanosensitive channel
MIRLLLALVLLLLVPIGAASAQGPLSVLPHAGTGPASPTSAATQSPSSATGITPEQARQALEVLNDPAKRAATIATLEAIARAQPAAAAPPTPAAALGLPLAPDSLGAAVLVGGANFMNELAEQVSVAVHAAHGLPALWQWLDTMATDPVARMLLADLAWRLAIALGGGFVVLWAITLALRRAMRAVGRRLVRLPPTAAPADPLLDPEAEDPLAPDSGEARAEQGEIEPPPLQETSPERMIRRVPLVLARAALDLLPVLGFLAAGHIIAGSALGGSSVIRLVLLAVIDSTGLCAAALRLARALLAPRHRRLRLLPVRDHTAAYALYWTRRLLVVSVFGYAIAEVGLLLGLSRAAHLALLKTVVLVLEICIGIVVVEKRRVVRGWLRAPPGAHGMVATVRNRIGAVWHWIALFYLAALWLVWAASLPAGYERVTRALLITLVVGVLARVVTRLCLDALERLVRGGSDLATRHPGLDGRLTFYQPFLRSFVQVGIALLALLVFLQLLGFDTFQWVTSSPLGQRITGSLVVLAFTFLLALGAWEGVNATIERHLARLTRQAQIARIARLRTLLPILRTALLIAVVTVTTLVVLSEIGVNTAPLLASAGIIGVAIGFGSQKLVQDLITGLFLLLDNTMQVGDVVNLAGLTGVVENLSVRTIRLRAEDGSVHVIPFSSVTTVTNMTRDYGRAVIQVGVAYKENVDRVVEVLKGILIEMRGDPQWKEVVLGDLEVYGLDQFAASAVIIKCRVMCTPFGRWSVVREFNRRMKARFEKLGIEMPSSDQRLILTQPLPLQQATPKVVAEKT